MEVFCSIFLQIIKNSIIASIIGMTILLIKKILYKFISPEIIYMMWGIFLIALVIPPFIESKTSIYNYVDIPNMEKIEFSRQEEIESKAMKEKVPSSQTTSIQKRNDLEDVTSNIQKDKLKKSNINIDFKVVISIVWLLGMFLSLLVYLISNIIFRIKVGRVIFEDERTQNILEFVRKEIRIKKNIILIKQDLVKTPAIIGIFKPKILLTENILMYKDLEIEYIFRHELSHYKRKDNIVNSVLIILRTIHWFNPIVWLIMKEIRKDMELVADERAIKDLEPSQRKEYCKLLVELASNNSESFMTKAIGITDDKNNLEKRIHMIKLTDKISKHPIFATGLVVVIIGLICMILYTNNYYLPNLEIPPKLYLKDRNGKVTEMALIEYHWLYNNEFKTYNVEFDPLEYEFKNENTIYKVSADYDDLDYAVYTEPKYHMDFFKVADYEKYVDYDKYKKSVYAVTGVTSENFDNEYNLLHISKDMKEIIVHFPNNSTATYVVKNMCFDYCDEEIFDKYENTSIIEINKIEELVKTMRLGEFLKDIKIENDVLYLNYDYAQDTREIADMCLVLFANIPELEKVVYTTNQKKVEQQEDNRWEKIVYNGTEPVEITKEIANKYGSMTLEELQKILNER